MEDRWAVHLPSSDGPLVVGVFDGHGGSSVAVALAENLCQSLSLALAAAGSNAEAENAAVLRCFLEADAAVVAADLRCGARDVRLPGAGSTAVVAAFLGDQVLLANVGDARAALGDASGGLLAVTVDQTPSVVEETQRVVALGGTVTHRLYDRKPRVAGVLAISRAFGNAGLKPFVTAEPVIMRVPLPEGRSALLLASDGLFDVLSTEDALRSVRSRARFPASALATRAKAMAQAYDNITVLTVHCSQQGAPLGAPPSRAPSPTLTEPLVSQQPEPEQPAVPLPEPVASPLVASPASLVCLALPLSAKRKSKLLASPPQLVT